MSNRIDKAFETASSESRAAFMPFFTAGDPDLAATGALIEEAARRGADVVELGIPFSDPAADGPTIQASFVRALEDNPGLRAIFDMVKDVRTRCEIPILTMVSFSIVNKVGPEAYFTMAADAGCDGVIIPDLPPDEDRSVAEIARAKGLHPVFLAAPTSTDARVKEIAAESRGFIYYISVAGTTGARSELPSDLAQHLAHLKTLTDKPIAVGFGVGRHDQVRAVAQHADGVIVGSAIVRTVHAAAELPRDEMVARVGDFIEELAKGKHRTASDDVAR
jgi:tryptophan synthase alpha chain